MAAQGARMRLTVVVEALAEENAHGEYRDVALAAFKERKFAMPVQLEDTFAAVWGDIEQRYKTNYLSPQQAATFAIKKLQDAYDCDLDMTDTVGAIFEGEPDRKMHLIKVVPYFVYRDTSVVPGSMLRPAGAQKRAGDDVDVDDAADGAHKRRRVESQRPGTRDPRDPSPDRPLPSTEVRQAAAVLETHAPRNPLPVRLSRSRSGASLVELRRTETGQAPFSPTPVKQESPEPGQLEQPMQTGQPAAVPAHAASPQRESAEATIHKSPLSSVEPAPAPVVNPRRDVYRVPSSPEFMHTKTTPDKPAKTYGRSPRSGAHLLNMARRLQPSKTNAVTAQPGASAATTHKARAFQRTRPDDIESTPHQGPDTGRGQPSLATSDDGDDDENVADLTASFLDDAAEAAPNSLKTPARTTAAKPTKPGSLKKPSRASLVTTPASIKCGAKPKAVTTPVNNPGPKRKTLTPSTVNPSSGEKVLGKETVSRMERLEKLLAASQNTPKRPGKASTPTRSSSIRSQDQSNRSSPEVRIPVLNRPTPGVVSTEGIDPLLAIHPSTAQSTPIKTTVKLPLPAKQASALATVSTSMKPKNSKGQNAFKKPDAKALGSSAVCPRAMEAPTPRRSEVPVPLNVRHLRRTSSLQSSPLSSGNNNTNNSSASVTAKTLARSSTTTSPSKDEKQWKSPKHATGVTDSEASGLAESRSSSRVDVGAKRPNGDAVPVDKISDQSKPSVELKTIDDTPTAPSQSQDKPPSGQDSSLAAPWSTESWDFKSLSHTNHTSDGHKDVCVDHSATAAARDFENEGHAEHEIYSTAIEDNTSRSHSSSANASARSSPAVSRRPARFLSHSPTPDASESEGDIDDASLTPSRAASPPAQSRDESASESESSSDSSEDEDIEMPDLQAEPIAESSLNAAPASSPPLAGLVNSTPAVPETSQVTASGIVQPAMRTPIPLPSQQSSQTPRSSQSVSLQAADRRRYTGFRSLREQLADTKAAQITTQKRAFDPRTMSLGRLTKGKPLASLGGGDEDDESSDDESSSSSSDSN